MAMTMLQMAGATPTPATMADGILLIIDAQREYTDGLLPLPGVQGAVDALSGLLEKARAMLAAGESLDTKDMYGYAPVGGRMCVCLCFSLFFVVPCSHLLAIAHRRTDSRPT